jgi:hypothetical protein
MEVHQHTHPSTSSGNRKKWFHYLWEFLMLFLAVFCGFLAEYQLEHKVEKDKAKQYVVSFYEDLKTDTAEFGHLITIDKNKLVVLSGARSCYNTVIKNPAASSYLEPIVRNSLGFINLVYTDRTLQQLKNAGGMRMLNQQDADSIYVYDNGLRSYLAFETSYLQERQTTLRNLYTKLLNYPDMTAMRFNEDSLLPANSGPLLFYAEKKELNELFNQISEYTRGISVRMSLMNDLRSSANRIIIYFKTKYNLE